jgi:PAS domain S-box-containing protein
MDAVVVLDADGGFARVNPAAEALFGCTTEDLVGENLRDFLPADDAAQFDAFVKELDAQPEGRRRLWIPPSFTVQRWNRTTIPAEATLSRFTNRGRVYHTVILRNVDDRLAAERRIELLSAEAEYLRESTRALAACGGKISGETGAAQRLGLAASTLSSRMKALGIQRKG